MGAVQRVPAAATEASLVWLASALPFLVEPFFAAGRFAGVSRAALAALPWIAWVGLPRVRRAWRENAATSMGTGASSRDHGSAEQEGSEESSLAGALFDVALCAPPIALGSWIDLESGVARNQIVIVALGSAALVLPLSLAARMASGSSLACRNHALMWLAFVAGLPLLRAALELGGQPGFGSMPEWLSWLARASPLAWIVARLDESSSASIFGSVVMALALIAIGMLANDRNGATDNAIEKAGAIEGKRP